MKFADFSDDYVLQYFGDVSVDGLKRYYVKEGYMATLPGVMDLDDSIDVVEQDDFDREDGNVVFTSKSGTKFTVAEDEHFELVVYIVQERCRFHSPKGSN